MAYFEDLSDYSYHDSYFYRPVTKNVGWLADGYEYPKGPPSEDDLEAIWEHCKVSIAKMRGTHECEWCPPRTSNYVKRRDEPLWLGYSEIRVFGEGGVIYAAPTLIYHYMLGHHYKPPDEFMEALREGPRPFSEQYFDRLKVLNLEWSRTSAPAAKPQIIRWLSITGGGWKRELY
jgi:hypothetical protein